MQLEVTSPDGRSVSIELAAGKTLLIGRAEEAQIRVTGDPHVSRRQAEVSATAGRLRVRKVSGASTAVCVDGAPKDDFELSDGGSFTIGRTRFRFVAGTPSPIVLQPPPDAPTERSPFALNTMSIDDLYSMGPRSPLRWDALFELPAILRSRQRADFYAHISRLLRESTRSAWACVIGEDDVVLGEDSAPDGGALRYRPSRALVRKALEDSPQPTLYSWAQGGQLQATAVAGLDWAACAATRVPGQPALVFYVAGRDAGGASSRQEEARFVGLVADMVGRSLAVDRLSTWEGRLERFFSGPVVSKILRSDDLRELEPRLAHSTVLFFDIRGFSRRTEEKTEEILRYIGELRKAMTAMTQLIQDEHGVVLQYAGDGILACWNVPFEEPDYVDRACRAALAMSRAIGRATAGWSCGIALHTGEVVAGAIGSEQVFSYSVLGPVVNQASRVEGITKLLGAPILVTGEVASKLSPATGAAVRVGRYQPAGMNSALELYELRERAEPAREGILADGLAAFERGSFDLAERSFASLGEQDGPAAFLRKRAHALISASPADWNGVIALERK